MASAMGTKYLLKLSLIILFAREEGSFPPQFISGPASDWEAKDGKRLQRLFLVLIRDRVLDAHGGKTFEAKAATMSSGRRPGTRTGSATR